MIPAGVLARMKMLTDAAIQSAAPIRAIQSDPNPLEPGTRFRAQIIAAQPDGTYRAQVGNRNLTLALPADLAAPAPGTTLELIVADDAPDSPPSPAAGNAQAGTGTAASRETAAPIRALLAQAATAANANPASTSSEAAPRLSPVAQLIGKLQAAEPAPLALAAGAPIAAGVSAAELAPALRSALEQSGVFYEAHQARWADGKLPLAQLRAEPQAQFASAQSAPETQNKSGYKSITYENTVSSPREAGARSAAVPAATARTTAPETGTAPVGGERAAALPEGLAPIVHKQLDTLASQQLAVSMQAWPGQQVEWEIDAPWEREVAPAEAPAPTEWRTRLALTLPRLGEVTASLTLNGERLQLHVSAKEEIAAEELARARAQLAGALAAAGLKLDQAQVKHDE